MAQVTLINPLDKGLDNNTVVSWFKERFIKFHVEYFTLPEPDGFTTAWVYTIPKDADATMFKLTFWQYTK